MFYVLPSVLFNLRHSTSHPAQRRQRMYEISDPRLNLFTSPRPLARLSHNCYRGEKFGILLGFWNKVVFNALWFENEATYWKSMYSPNYFHFGILNS